MPSRITESRNGTRQPQAENSSGVIAARVAAITASDSSSPPIAIAGMQLVCRPRRPGWRVLGDVDDGAAKLAADREPLEDRAA